MEIIGQIGDRAYVVDRERDVLFVADGTAVDVEVPSPDEFLKFNGAYLQPYEGHESTLLQRVERFAADRPPPLPSRGDPPEPGGQVFVVGELPATGTKVLSARPGPATADTKVWLESDPSLVTSMDDVDAIHAVEWWAQPAVHEG